MSVLHVLYVLIRNIVTERAELSVEDLALRQYLAVLVKQKKRPRLRKRDRIFWVCLSRFSPKWRELFDRHDVVRFRRHARFLGHLGARLSGYCP